MTHPHSSSNGHSRSSKSKSSHSPKPSSADPLAALHGKHPLHKAGESSYYSAVINKKLENMRAAKFLDSVDSWKKEVHEKQADLKTDRDKREASDLELKKQAASAVRPPSAPSSRSSLLPSPGSSSLQAGGSPSSSAATSQDAAAAAGNKEGGAAVGVEKPSSSPSALPSPSPATLLSAGGGASAVYRNPNRPKSAIGKKNDWKGMYEAGKKTGARLEDDDDMDDDLADLNSFETLAMASSSESSLPLYSSLAKSGASQGDSSFCPSKSGRNSLYEVSSSLPHPCPQVPVTLRFNSAVSNPFSQTLRKAYKVEEAHRARERAARFQKKPKKAARPPPITPPPPASEEPPEQPYEPPSGAPELTEEDANNYFGADARSKYFQVYRTLSRQRLIIDLKGKPLSGYMAPAFADDEYFPSSSADSDSHRAGAVEELQDEAQPDDHAIGVFSEGAKSPRHRMGAYCVEKGHVLPEPIIIRHQLKKSDGTVNDRIDLSGRGLGDAIVEMLSDIIDEIPVVRHINLRDNRLTDETVQMVVASLTQPDNPMHLLSLDLSGNKIDSATAISLAKFFKKKTCVLEELYLSKADLDDIETAAFCDALEMNRTIKVLDFSHNVIGGVREYMHRTVPSFSDRGRPLPTGGQALATALEVNNILTKLDLSWNQMGAKSGVVIGAMLAINSGLKWLDLGYNCLQEEGAQSICYNLGFNKTLEHLNIEYNLLGPEAACILANSLKMNRTIKTVKLKGNSIGEVGARAVFRSMKYDIEGRKIDITGCDLSKTSQDFFKMKETKFGSYPDKSASLFDFHNPEGYYRLNMDHPHNQFKATELYYLASLSSQYHFKMFKHNGRDVTLKAPSKQARQKRVISKRREPEIRHIADLVKMRCHTTSYITTLDADEFIDACKAYMLIDQDTKSEWYAPTTGICEIVFHFSPMPEAESNLANAAQIRRLCDLLVENPSGRVEAIKIFSLDCRVLSSQLQQILDCVTTSAVRSDADAVVAMFRCLAPTCVDIGSIESLFECNLSLHESYALQATFGHLYSILQGTLCGHYVLDMKNEFDKMSFLRLAELNSYEKLALQTKSGWSKEFGATSQDGSGNQFRNMVFREEKMVYKETFVNRKLSDLSTGVLEFDFVSTTRIPLSEQPMSSIAFKNFLRACDLEKESAHEAQPNSAVSSFSSALDFIRRRASVEYGDRAENKERDPTLNSESRQAGEMIAQKIHGGLKLALNTKVDDVGPLPAISRNNLGPRQRREAASHAHTGGDVSKEGFDARKLFLHGIEKVVAKNLADGRLFGRSALNFSKLKMMEWLTLRSPDAGNWKEELVDSVFRMVDDSVCEFASTAPLPTRMQHVLQIRIVDRYKFEALEYETLVPSPSGMIKKKQNFFYFALKFENEKPIEAILPFSEKIVASLLEPALKEGAALPAGSARMGVVQVGNIIHHDARGDGIVISVDGEQRRHVKYANGEIHKYAASSIVTETAPGSYSMSKKAAKKLWLKAVRRRYVERHDSPFDPVSVPGVKTVCTFHCVDVVVGGMSDRRSFATHLREKRGAYGFDSYTGQLDWRWVDISATQDITISYQSMADKYLKITGKLEGRVFTCSQAADMCACVPIDESDYVLQLGDRVSYLKRGGGGVPHSAFGRVRSLNADGTVDVVPLQGAEEKGVHVRTIVPDSTGGKRFREDLVVALFGHVCDLENYHLVVATLPTSGRLSVYRRLGYLNAVSMQTPSHFYSLDLSSSDEWLLANALFKLHAVEDPLAFSDAAAAAEGGTLRCPGDPCGRLFCDRTKRCCCHFYISDRHLVDGKRSVGFAVPSGWDDAKVGPDLRGYARASGKKGGGGRGGGYRGRGGGCSSSRSRWRRTTNFGRRLTACTFWRDCRRARRGRTLWRGKRH